MASRSDIQAGRAAVTLYAKTAPLVKGLQIAKAAVVSFGATVASMAAALASMAAAAAAALTFAIGGGLVSAIVHFTKAGSALNDMSERTGVAASTLAELGYAAEQTGASMEDVEMAIKKSQKAGKNFFTIADEIRKMEDPAQRTRKALEAWGKSGTNLLPMVDDLEALRQAARDKGLIPSDESVKAADEIGDRFDDVFKQIKAMMYEIGALAAPFLIPIAAAIQKTVKATIDWLRESKGILEIMRAIGDAIMADNFALAWQIATLTIQIAFAKLWLGVLQGWIAAKNALLGGLATLQVEFGAKLAFLGGLASGTADQMWKSFRFMFEALSKGWGLFAKGGTMATGLIGKGVGVLNKALGKTSEVMAKGLKVASKMADKFGKKGLETLPKVLDKAAAFDVNAAMDKGRAAEETARTKLDAARIAAEEARKAADDEKIAAAKEAVDRLEGELADAIAKAKEERAAKLDAGGKPRKDGDAFSGMPGKPDVTFSAAALTMIGRGPKKDPVVAAVGKVEKVNEKMLKAIEAGGLFVA